MPTSALYMKAERVAALHEVLIQTVEHLNRRRASAVDERDVEDYLALGWFRWHAGSLRLTPAGHAVYAKLLRTLHERETPDEPDAMPAGAGRSAAQYHHAVPHLG